jgi:Ceramidase
MTLGSTKVAPVNGTRAVFIMLPVMLASLLALLLVPPFPQDQAYHQFADQRRLLGIPNFWNVVSNLPFIAAGAAGLWRGKHDAATFVIFTAMVLTGLGSSYYHWSPSDGTLFWDRLPMALCFMAIFAAAIEERLDARAGGVMLGPLLVLGVVSLLVWRWTDDLRLYGWVQFFPCLALPLMFLLYPPKYTGTWYWIVAAGLYLVAKVFEYSDRAIYSVGNLLSGHTLKHLAAAAACFAILRYFQTRRPIA